uniref:Uncharacterized protein n=1 Tax=Cacopsylla melanoneura TaxID=428564 RepID=A0A8D8VT57_9HEMI
MMPFWLCWAKSDGFSYSVQHCSSYLRTIGHDSHCFDSQHASLFYTVHLTNGSNLTDYLHHLKPGSSTMHDNLSAGLVTIQSDWCWFCSGISHVKGDSNSLLSFIVFIIETDLARFDWDEG